MINWEFNVNQKPSAFSRQTLFSSTTFMDGYSRYNQISITQEDHHKTAFTTPWDTFIYVVISFGLCNALATFQRAMFYTFFDLLYKSMMVFIDDFSTQSSKINHLECVRASLQWCQRTKVVLNLDKIFLAVQKGVLLGYVVSKNGREPDPKKIKVIVELKPPSIVKEVQRILGYIGWYWEVIKDYAILSMPITRVIQKEIKFVWSEKFQEAFDILKEKLSAFSILKPPNWSLPFNVLFDTSSVAVGSTLYQASGKKGKKLSHSLYK